MQLTIVKVGSAPAARSSASSGISNVSMCRSVSVKSLPVSISFEIASSFVQSLSQPVRSRFMLHRGRRDCAQL